MSDPIIQALMDKASESRRAAREYDILLDEAKENVKSLEAAIIQETQAAEDLETAAKRLREAES